MIFHRISLNELLHLISSDTADLIANSSSSMPSNVTPTFPDNALPWFEKPDQIFHLLLAKTAQILSKSL